MHPVLFYIAKFPIHSYGFMLAVSFLLGIWLSTHRARKANLDPNVVMDFGFWLILSAIVGARLYYVVLFFDSFKNDLLSIVNPFQGGEVGIGGLVMYGGFIGAILSGIIYFRVRKQPFLPYADAIAPSVGIGIFLTRIGCFLNGCCYGAPATGTMAVSFPHDSPSGAYQAHMHATGLFPSQLFESLGGLLIAIVVLIVGRKKLFEGFQFYLTGILYCVLRFCIDFSRFYGASERLGPLSHNQVVCIALFILFGGLIIKNIVFKEDPAQNAGSASEPSLMK